MRSVAYTVDVVKDAAEVIVLFVCVAGLGPDDAEAEPDAAYELDTVYEPDAEAELEAAYETDATADPEAT
jgi:hypothetical protein